MLAASVAYSPLNLRDDLANKKKKFCLHFNLPVKIWKRRAWPKFWGPHRWRWIAGGLPAGNLETIVLEEWRN
jgi:hypothetical protein